MAKRSTYRHKLTKRDKNAFDKKMSTITSHGDPEKAVEGAINRVVTQFFDLPESVGETINSYPLKTDGVTTVVNIVQNPCHLQCSTEVSPHVDTIKKSLSCKHSSIFNAVTSEVASAS